MANCGGGGKDTPFHSCFIYQDRRLKFDRHIVHEKQNTIIRIYVGQLIQGRGKGWQRMTKDDNGWQGVVTGDDGSSQVISSGNGQQWVTTGYNGWQGWQRVTTGDDKVQVQHECIFFYLIYPATPGIPASIYIFVARKMSVRGITPKLIDLQLKMIHHWIRLIAASIY